MTIVRRSMTLGIDTSFVLDVPTELTGSSFMPTDLTGNQIAGFYPGASSQAETISVSELGRDALFGFVGADHSRGNATPRAGICRVRMPPYLRSLTAGRLIGR